MLGILLLLEEEFIMDGNKMKYASLAAEGEKAWKEKCNIYDNR